MSFQGSVSDIPLSVLWKAVLDNIFHRISLCSPVGLELPFQWYFKFVVFLFCFNRVSFDRLHLCVYKIVSSGVVASGSHPVSCAPPPVLVFIVPSLIS